MPRRRCCSGGGGSSSLASCLSPGFVWPPTCDAAGAAILDTLYCANPATEWDEGTSITVEGCQFYWDGANWQPGVAPAQVPTITGWTPGGGWCEDIITFTGRHLDKWGTPLGVMMFVSAAGTVMASAGPVSIDSPTQMRLRLMALYEGKCQLPSGGTFYFRLMATDYDTILWENLTDPFIIDTNPRDPAIPSTVYVDAPEITAQDAANAALLTGLGFVAEPQTPWYNYMGPLYFGNQTTSVTKFMFHWDGTAWQPDTAGMPPAPVVSFVQPPSGPIEGGTPITIVGSNFTDVEAVTLRTSPLRDMVVVDPFTITGTTTPNDAGWVPVIVVGPNQLEIGILPNAFEYIGTVNLTAVTPPSVDAGVVTRVTVTGTRLDTVTSATLRGQLYDRGQIIEGVPVPLTVVSRTATQIVLDVPAAVEPTAPVARWEIHVNGPEGGAAIVLGRQFNRADTQQERIYTGITEITAEDQANADLLTGLGFVANPQTPWPTMPGYFSTDPRGPGDLPILFNFWWDGAAWRPGYATAPPPPLAVTSVAPTTGPAAGGTSLAVTGTGFSGTLNGVYLCGAPVASYTVQSDTQMTVVTAAGTGGAACDLTIYNPGAPVTLAGAFTYEAPPPPPVQELYDITYDLTNATVTRKDGTGTGDPITIRWADNADNPTAETQAVIGTPVPHAPASTGMWGVSVWGIWAFDAEGNWGVTPYANGDDPSYGFTVSLPNATVGVPTRLVLSFAPTATKDLTLDGGHFSAYFGLCHPDVTASTVTATLVSSDLAGATLQVGSGTPGVAAGKTFWASIQTTQAILEAGQTYTVQLDLTFAEAVGVVDGGASADESVNYRGPSELFTVTVT